MDADKSSTVLNDVEVTGTINFRGRLSFDGKLQKGDMNGEDFVLGGKARIDGNISAASLVLHGSVTGDVMVSGRCELKDSASLVGSLVTNRLAMDEGATLIGDVEITPQSKAASLPSKSTLPAK